MGYKLKPATLISLCSEDKLKKRKKDVSGP